MKMTWWKKLSLKISLFILTLALVPLFIFGTLSISQMTRTLSTQIASYHRSIVESAADVISAGVVQILYDIQVICDNAGIESALPEDQEWTLQFLLKSFPQVKTLSLFDPKGMETMRLSRDRMTLFNQGIQPQYTADLFQRGRGKTYDTQLHRNPDGLLLFDALIPFMLPTAPDSGYLLKISIDVAHLLDLMADRYRHAAGTLYVVDQNGVILSHPDRSLVLAGEKARYAPHVTDFMAQKRIKGGQRTYLDRNGRQVVSSAWQTDPLKLLVVFETPYDQAFESIRTMSRNQWMWLISVAILALVLILYFFMKIVKPVKKLESGVDRIASGVFDMPIPVISDDEMGKVTRAVNTMASNLNQVRTQEEERTWIQQGITLIDNTIRGAEDFKQLSHDIIRDVCRYIDAHIGLIYIKESKDLYRYMAGYAVQPGGGMPETFRSGQGLTGQCVADKCAFYFNNVSQDYVVISSTLGKAPPNEIVIVPLVHDDVVEGVIEMGTMHPLSHTEKGLLDSVADRIAVVLASVRSREALKAALARTHKQNEELERQQIELESVNEELEAQSQMLVDSEGQLKRKHEELEKINTELEEKSQYLEKSKREVEQKNRTLEALKRELEAKAEDLTAANQYKSEFLANMSHELRTPLNSLLLLSRHLCRNKEKNLTEAQIESMTIIYNSGSDLLDLINDILDLSKIEAGRMTLHCHSVAIEGVAADIKRQFFHLAREKGLGYHVNLLPECPKNVITDPQRLAQILKNLISNALKFTEQGEISVTFSASNPLGDFPKEERAGHRSKWLRISVKDSGIGIPAEKQDAIFEAFHQIESSSTRKHGGTGLGLSISLQLTRLLGGKLAVESDPEKGSEFVLTLPTTPPGSEISTLSESKSPSPESQATSSHTIPPEPHPSTSQVHGSQEKLPMPVMLSNDPEAMIQSEKSLLIIEDDLNFGRSLMRLCLERGFQCIYAATGEEGIHLAHTYMPKAILLDIRLPGIDGWEVLERLKASSQTRHIPVHFMSVDPPRYQTFAKGAIGYLQKPVTDDALERAMAKIETMIQNEMKNLLIVEDDPRQVAAIRKLIGGEDVTIFEAGTGQEAIETLEKMTLDCIILDIGLPDMSGFDLLERLPLETLPPVIIYTGKELTPTEEKRLQSFSQSIIIKGVCSNERLLDEVSLFLHRVMKDLPDFQKERIHSVHDGNHMLKGKKILIVDDDMRNVFALAKVLEDLGMETLKAENGKKALDHLHKIDDIDMVLMDIMMPVMDGYETIREIRKELRFAKLPIIALTAKAMKQDKARCIEAGANDYLSKPVDIDRLISMMRVWLYE